MIHPSPAFAVPFTFLFLPSARGIKVFLLYPNQWGHCQLLRNCQLHKDFGTFVLCFFWKSSHVNILGLIDLLLGMTMCWKHTLIVDTPSHFSCSLFHDWLNFNFKCRDLVLYTDLNDLNKMHNASVPYKQVLLLLGNACFYWNLKPKL